MPLFTRFYTSQVVQDFFHQQYGSSMGMDRMDMAWDFPLPGGAEFDRYDEDAQDSRHEPPKTNGFLLSITQFVA